MSRLAPATAGGSFARYAILVLLALAPPLAGAVHAVVFVPLLVCCALVGLFVLLRGRGRRGRHSPLPAARVLLALHGLVLLQLVPLPPALLHVLSPGSYDHYDRLVLTPPLAAWRPISVSPPDTLCGLAFLAAFSLLALAVFRELGSHPWRRRLPATVVGTGLFITVVAFVQAVSPEPHRLYGLWRPRWDWAVFGPYVNRSHFAGYLVMALPLAIGFALEAWGRLRAAWRRRRGPLALGDAEGAAAVRASVVVMVLAAGLLASGSRGGIVAFAASALLLPLASRERWRTGLAVAALAGLGLAWIGLGGFLAAMQTRGIRASRVDLWQDMLPMARRFPLFGVGLNAFSTAYPFYQTVWKTEWIGEAHDEYLQALLDTGVLGAALFAAVLVIVFRRALARAASSPLDLGVFGALAALAIHNTVDFNWQIPANAATWVALAALACRERDHRDPNHEIP